ncbi:MAG: hypothetical protein ABII82_05175 [Verrucomicrobiota bacterium]
MNTHSADSAQHTATNINAPADPLAASRQTLRDFGRHFDYDVSYLLELADASPEAFRAFEAAMPMARVQSAASTEALHIAKIAGMRAQDCGPCTELALKIAREAGVAETVIQGALHGGQGLDAEQRDLHDYARAVALNEEMDPALLPRLKARLGRAALAEIAVNLVGMRLYPTLKRALGHAKSCALFPALQ